MYTIFMPEQNSLIFITVKLTYICLTLQNKILNKYIKGIYFDIHCLNSLHVCYHIYFNHIIL